MSFRSQWKLVTVSCDERSSRASYRPERFLMGVRPLSSGPVTEVPLVSQFDVNDLVLNDYQLATLEERFAALHNEDQGRFDSAARKSAETISSLYGSAAELHNSVSDSLQVYSKLYSVHDYSIWRLIRAKMANIFRPSFWKAIMRGASGSSVSIFGSKEVVLKRITDRKAVDQTLKGALLLPIKKKAKGKGKNAKAKNAQNPADSAKSADRKGGSKAVKAKKAKAAAKAKAKKAKVGGDQASGKEGIRGQG